MGNAFGGQAQKQTINNSRDDYTPTDIALCKCTPPAEICIYGICFWPLMSVTKQKMQWLEQANNTRAFLRYKPGEIVFIKRKLNNDISAEGKSKDKARVVEDLGGKISRPYRLELIDNEKQDTIVLDDYKRERYFTADEIESNAQHNAHDKLVQLQQNSTCCCGAIKTEGYYGNGWTSSTLMNIVAQQALGSFGSGNNEGEMLGNLYAASAVMNMRSQFDDSNVAGGFTTCLKTVCCASCVNCNNAYVVNNAVKKYLREHASAPSETREPTSVNQQPGAIQVTYKPANRELDALLF